MEAITRTIVVQVVGEEGRGSADRFQVEVHDVVFERTNRINRAEAVIVRAVKFLVITRHLNDETVFVIHSAQRGHVFILL